MALPKKTEKKKSLRGFDQDIVVIYGPPGVGKTTLAAQWPDPIFFSTCAGYRHVEMYEPVVIKDWADFIGACTDLAAGGHGYKTVVIDTIDKLGVMLRDHICKNRKVEHPSDIGSMGKGFDIVTSKLDEKVLKLTQLGYGVVFVGHDTSETIKTPTKEYEKRTLRLSGKQRGVILDNSDHILYMTTEIIKKEKRRVIHTDDSPYHYAKFRGEIAERVIVDPNENTYEYLAKHVEAKEEEDESTG